MYTIYKDYYFIKSYALTLKEVHMLDYQVPAGALSGRKQSNPLIDDGAQVLLVCAA